MTSASTTSAPRPTATTARGRSDYPALSGARAIAAYMVIAVHVGFQTGRSLDNRPFAPFLARAEFGVTIFFLLSGFLLSRAFLKPGTTAFEPRQLLSFWWRRLLRILPAYWLTIVVVLGVMTSYGVTHREWWAYLTMRQTYSHLAVDPSLSQTWTLSVELMFYFALPLLVALSRLLPTTRQNRSAALLILLLAISIATNLVVHHGTNAETYWMPLYLDWFGLGIYLATLAIDAESPARWQRQPLRWAQSPGYCWLMAMLFYWLSTLPLAGPQDLANETTWEFTFKHYLYGGSAFFFLLPLVVGSAAWTDRLLGGRVMRFLGEISYGVYLWHLPMLIALQLRWFGYSIFGGHFRVLFPLTAIAATLAATASWYLLERPLLRRFSHSWRRTVLATGPDHEQAQRDQTQHLQASAVS